MQHMTPCPAMLRGAGHMSVTIQDVPICPDGTTGLRELERLIHDLPRESDLLSLPHHELLGSDDIRAKSEEWADDFKNEQKTYNHT